MAPPSAEKLKLHTFQLALFYPINIQVYFLFYFFHIDVCSRVRPVIITQTSLECFNSTTNLSFKLCQRSFVLFLNLR